MQWWRKNIFGKRSAEEPNGRVIPLRIFCNSTRHFKNKEHVLRQQEQTNQILESQFLVKNISDY